jgi:hypothetical protein
MKSSKTGKVFGGAIYRALSSPNLLPCERRFSVQFLGRKPALFISVVLCFLTSTFDYNETLVPIIHKAVLNGHGLLSRDIVLREGR